MSEFDSSLSESNYCSKRYRRRYRFVPLAANNKGREDPIIEFVPEGSELDESLNEAYHQQIALNETERPKYLPKQIVDRMQSEGFTLSKMHNHIELWQSMDAKNPGKGYGVQVANTWYWYDRWLDEVRTHCSTTADKYVPKSVA